MKKLFISQPSSEMTDDELREVRNKAKKCAEGKLGEPVEALGTFYWKEPVENVSEDLFFLGNAISILSQADIAYFCKGWEEVRGCRIEHTCAVEYGVEVIEE